jgi:dienelactone hydrolase
MIQQILCQFKYLFVICIDVKQEDFFYIHDEITFKGKFFYEIEGKPVVLVLPTWMGLDAFAFQKAEEIAQCGFSTYLVDMYGEGLALKNGAEAKKQIAPLLADRQILRDRLQNLLQAIKKHPKIDPDRIAAVGYCFGGTSVIELAKSGADLRGVVSIHGVLGNPHQIKMKPVPTADQIRASLLLLHGYQDTMTSEQELHLFAKEMAERGADWQIILYGGAMHGYTNPDANKPELSLQYNEKAAKRSLKATKSFLDEIFT